MIVAITGMAREAEIVSVADVAVLVGALQPQRLREQANIAAQNASGIISIGIAGGLDPQFRAGDVIVAAQILSEHARHHVDLAWMQRIAAKLPNAVVAPILGLDAMTSTREAKAQLLARYGAPAVDMESHIVAEVAATHHLPFASLRVVCDGADDTLPHAARNAIAPDGTVALGRVLGGLLLRPYEIPALIRLGNNSRKAFAELLRCRDRLGSGLGGLG